MTITTTDEPQKPQNHRLVPCVVRDPISFGYPIGTPVVLLAGELGSPYGATLKNIAPKNEPPFLISVVAEHWILSTVIP